MEEEKLTASPLKLAAEKMNSVDIQKIKKIVQKAGKEIMKYYNCHYGVSYKNQDKSSPLTKADLASEKIIKQELKKFKLPILSEEAEDDKTRLNSNYVWIVDPLDGTSDFIGKTGEFVVMIGLAREKKPILGAIYQPISGKLYWAEKGKGAWLEWKNQKRKLKTSEKSNFMDASILISRNHLGKLELALTEKAGIGNKITLGSAGLKMAVIAEGKAEIYINSSNKTSEWDTCAGAIIIREAGGKITDMDGKELNYNNNNPAHLKGFVVSNGILHNKIIKVLKNV